MDAGVAGAAPFDFTVALLHGHLEAVFAEPQERLARAAQFGHLVEDQFDRSLYPAIWILLEMVAHLHEADRRCND